MSFFNFLKSQQNICVADIWRRKSPISMKFFQTSDKRSLLIFCSYHNNRVLVKKNTASWKSVKNFPPDFTHYLCLKKVWFGCLTKVKQYPFWHAFIMHQIICHSRRKALNPTVSDVSALHECMRYRKPETVPNADV